MNKPKLVTRNVTVRATVQLEVADEGSDEDIRDQITSYLAALQDPAHLDRELRCPRIQTVDNVLITDKENKYQCPKCGNTDSFTELVWEQRRYSIDGAGEAIGVSERVEDTEIPILISCTCCGAVVTQREISLFRAGTYITNRQSKQKIPNHEARQT